MHILEQVPTRVNGIVAVVWRALLLIMKPTVIVSYMYNAVFYAGCELFNHVFFRTTCVGPVVCPAGITPRK